MTTRFQIVWAPLLGIVGAVVIGATPRRAWVEVTPNTVEVRFGFLGSARIPRNAILQVRPITWPWYFGYGIRLYGLRSVGFVGRSRGVVEFQFAEPVRIHAVIPFSVRKLAVSVDEPEKLVDLFR